VLVESGLSTANEDEDEFLLVKPVVSKTTVSFAPLDEAGGDGNGEMAESGNVFMNE
jgi:hypothetical protein